MKLTRAAAEIFIYRVFTEKSNDYDQDILKNGYMILGDALRRCNYVASVEGIVTSHIIRKNLRKHLPEGPIIETINFIIVVVEMVVNLLDDFVGFQLTFMGFKQHKDFYNAGLLLGRLAKNIVAFYT